MKKVTKNDEGLLASMCEAIIEDSNDILNKLRNSELEPPTWWTSKLAVSSAYLNSLRDFITYNTDELEVEEDEEEEADDIELIDNPTEATEIDIADEMLPPSARMMKNATKAG